MKAGQNSNYTRTYNTTTNNSSLEQVRPHPCKNPSQTKNCKEKLPGRNLVLAKVYGFLLETPVSARPLASDDAVVVVVDQDEVGAGAPEKKIVKQFHHRNNHCDLTRNFSTYRFLNMGHSRRRWNDSYWPRHRTTSALRLKNLVFRPRNSLQIKNICIGIGQGPGVTFIRAKTMFFSCIALQLYPYFTIDLIIVQNNNQ